MNSTLVLEFIKVLGVSEMLQKKALKGNKQTVALSKIIQHEDYNGFTISNDISLLKLSQPLTFNDYVGPIALPEAGHAASGECIVSGWGALSEGGSSPSVFQKVSVPIVSYDACA
ncbi:trypsin-1-like [Penaeus indicus]|uniref:trypsin-1-like n=1 Tax=Penaeus indicus TaxID=29960 RepID=UPI00300CE722